MSDKFYIKFLKRKLSRNITNAAIKDLKSIKQPEDFSSEHAYSLIQTAFSFFIAQGKSPNDIKLNLNDIVDQAHNDFLLQVNASGVK